MTKKKSTKNWLKKHTKDKYVRMSVTSRYRSRAFHKLQEIEGIIAGYYNDLLIGNNSNNIFDAEKGNDTIIGNEGEDIAIYRGSKDNYKISQASTSEWITISDKSNGRDGIDKLLGIEKVQFNGKLFSISELVGSASSETTGFFFNDSGHLTFRTASGDDVALTYGGQALTKTSWGYYTVQGVVQTASGGFEIQWDYNGSSYYSGHNAAGANSYWTSFSSHNYSDALTAIDPNANSISAENNKDLITGASSLEDHTLIEKQGDITLIMKPDTSLGYAMNASGELSAIKYNNQQVGNKTWQGWEMLGAETNEGINQVAWSNGSGVWVSNHDANWNATSGTYFAQNSDAFKALETGFQQDLNKDGII